MTCTVPMRFGAVADVSEAGIDGGLVFDRHGAAAFVADDQRAFVEFDERARAGQRDGAV